MRVPVLVPAFGELIAEVTILRWMRAVGEAVAVDEPLVELDTDKIDLVLPSPVAGVIAEIRVEAGGKVAVGTEIAVIERR